MGVELSGIKAGIGVSGGDIEPGTEQRGDVTSR